MAIGYRALRRNEPLARHTSFGVGGPASFFYEPCDAEEVMALLELVEPESDILVLGHGTNVLVSDDGFYGLVVRLVPPPVDAIDLVNIDKRGDACLVTASGAARWDDLVRWCTYDAGLSGIECMSGIPGTVGAAVAGNIGAYGQQISDVFKSAEFIRLPDSSGTVELKSTDDVGIRYLLDEEHAKRGIRLSACHPNDVLSRVAEICRYEGVPPRLDNDLVERACRDYFTEL